MHKKDLVKAQKQMEQLQQHIAELSCEGAVSGGLVTVTMSGHYQVMSVEIKPEAMKLERDELGQLISTATMRSRKFRKNWLNFGTNSLSRLRRWSEYMTTGDYIAPSCRQ